jgi:hypothetical protein
VLSDYIARNEMKPAPYQPYSPDLAPFDFFLFGHVKGKLMGYQAGSAAKLLVRIQVILAEIPWEALNTVFSSGCSDCKSVSTAMEHMSSDLNKHQTSDPFLFVRLRHATPAVGHPINVSLK